jgi:uncharacterized HAD superfamily protein
MPAFMLYWKENYDWVVEDYDEEGKCLGWNMPMPPDYNFKDIHDDIAKAINTYQNYLYPHAFAMEMIRELARASNSPPVIITARREDNRDVTNEWLQYHLGIPFDLRMVNNGPKMDVIAECQGMQYFVEDRFKAAHDISHVCDKVYMPRQPWNQGREITRENVIPVHNLVEVYNDILGNDTEDDAGSGSTPSGH